MEDVTEHPPTHLNINPTIPGSVTQDMVCRNNVHAGPFVDDNRGKYCASCGGFITEDMFTDVSRLPTREQNAVPIAQHRNTLDTKKYGRTDFFSGNEIRKLQRTQFYVSRTYLQTRLADAKDIVHAAVKTLELPTQVEDTAYGILYGYLTTMYRRNNGTILSTICAGAVYDACTRSIPQYPMNPGKIADVFSKMPMANALRSWDVLAMTRKMHVSLRLPYVKLSPEYTLSFYIHRIPMSRDDIATAKNLYANAAKIRCKHDAAALMHGAVLLAMAHGTMKLSELCNLTGLPLTSAHSYMRFVKQASSFHTPSVEGGKQ